MGISSKMSPELLFSCVLLGLVGVVAFVSNLLVLRTMIVCTKIRNSLFVVCSGIALADLLYVVVAIPVEIINNSQEPRLINERLCKTVSYLAHTAHYVSIYLIVALTIVRAIFLTTRIDPGPTALKGLIATVLLWTAALLLDIPLLNYPTLIDKHSGNCLLPAMIDYRSGHFTHLSVAFSYVVPTLAMAVIYAVTYALCRRYCADTHSFEDKQMARLVTVVVSVFVVFWLPLHLLVIFTYRHYSDAIRGPSSPPSHQDEMVAGALYVAVNFVWAITQIDKCIRPLIYMCISYDFKRSYDEIVDCTLCCGEKGSGLDDRRLDMSHIEPLRLTEKETSSSSTV